MIERFCEGTAYRLLTEGQGHNSLHDRGYSIFCAWDWPSEDRAVVQVEIGVEGSFDGDFSQGEVSGFTIYSSAASEQERIRQIRRSLIALF